MPAQKQRWVAGLAGVLVLLVGSALLSVLVGARATHAGEIFAALPAALHAVVNPVFAESMPFDEMVLLLADQRIPRTALALIAGMALGAAGALIQGYTRNPLADPGILGVNAGATAAVALSVFAGGVSSAGAYVWPAFIGALIATALLFLLSSTGTTAANPLTFVLAGMTVSALLMALVNALMLSDTGVLDALRTWATGSVAGRDFSVVRTVAPLAIIGLVLAIACGRALNLLSLGEDTAATLGLPVRGARILGLLTIALLGAVAVAAAGPVAFIGLAAPHIVRGFVGADYRQIIPGSILVGGVIALWADILGRYLARPGELAMGIVVVLFGVPLFIWLVRRGKVSGAL